MRRQPQVLSWHGQQEAPKIPCGTEQGRAAGRNDQQHALDPPRTIPIQKNANGDLGACKDKEINRCQQPGLGGIKPKIGRQCRRDRGIDRSKEEREIIASGKGKEDGQDQSPLLARVFAEVLMFIRIRFGVCRRS